MNITTSRATASLLYVEDDENDLLLMEWALKRVGVQINFHSVDDGDKAMRYLGGEPPFAERTIPDLVLLDLKLPRYSGFDVLEWRRGRLELERTPIVIFSASNRSEDIERGRLLGAADYLCKPSTNAQFDELVRTFWSRWLSPEIRAVGLPD